MEKTTHMLILNGLIRQFNNVPRLMSVQ